MVSTAPTLGETLGRHPSSLPPIYRGGEGGQTHPSKRRCYPSSPSKFLSFFASLGEALLILLHHHHHHVVVLPENSSYHFTIARWIQESSSLRVLNSEVSSV